MGYYLQEKKIYICNNPEYFSSRSNEHYTYIGSCNSKNEDTYEVYPRTLIFGEDGDIIIKDNVSNAINTKFKDASWLSGGDRISSLSVNGGYAYTSDSGILTLNFLPYPDYRDPSSNTRLCYIP